MSSIKDIRGEAVEKVRKKGVRPFGIWRFSNSGVRKWGGSLGKPTLRKTDLRSCLSDLKKIGGRGERAKSGQKLKFNWHSRKPANEKLLEQGQCINEKVCTKRSSGKPALDP